MEPEQEAKWTALQQKVTECKACSLHLTRIQAVFGEGDLSAPFLFVGEAPGSVENVKGRPFIGKTGVFLRKKMYEAGFRKGDVYITNTVRCRPPDNREPLPEELSRCFGYLHEQIKLIQPKCIVAVGSVAFKMLVPNSKKKIGAVRGDRFAAFGCVIVPTWHPSYVLRSFNILREKELLKDLRRAYEEFMPEERKKRSGDDGT